MQLNEAQENAVAAAGHLFLLGPAGAGKTIALQERLRRLLTLGEPAYTVLVLIAELEQREGYLAAAQRPEIGPYAELKVITYPSLAREMIGLFWPLVAREAGFARPYQPPTFLSYDLAQLMLWDLVNRTVAEGGFANLRLRPQQIVSQILDTLNRAALNGFTVAGAIERQIATWTGNPEHIRHLRQVEAVAQAFRATCRDNNLLDLSLIVSAFDRHLVQHPEFSRYFSERFRHLMVDNVEEQTPAGQHFVAELMPHTVSTAIAYDEGGGYKRFLSADPALARGLAEACEQTIRFDESFTAPEPVRQLGHLVSRYLVGPTGPVEQAGAAILGTVQGRYRGEMIDELVLALANLVQDQGVPPAAIALIAPYLDGALNFALTRALKEVGLPYFVLRRRSSPREEPRVRAWLTWLALAHPAWGVPVSAYDVAEALSLSIQGLDPARAALLTEHLYRPEEGVLLPADGLSPAIVDRAGVEMVELVEALRLWLEAHGGQYPLDGFLYHLFNDLLAGPDFRPEPDVAGAAVCDWLVRTAGRLRQAAQKIGLFDEARVGAAFIDGINQGLVTADPPDLGDPPDPEGIMVSTAYGFLLSERVVEVQVWLETAAQGWWDIPRQPLSNVFVLAESWPAGRLWTMEEELRVRNQLLSQVVQGLVARCTGGVLLAHSELDRRGQVQDGPLWRALQFVRTGVV